MDPCLIPAGLVVSSDDDNISGGENPKDTKKAMPITVCEGVRYMHMYGGAFQAKWDFLALDVTEYDKNVDLYLMLPCNSVFFFHCPIER